MPALDIVRQEALDPLLVIESARPHLDLAKAAREAGIRSQADSEAEKAAQIMLDNFMAERDYSRINGLKTNSSIIGYQNGSFYIPFSSKGPRRGPKGFRAIDIRRYSSEPLPATAVEAYQAASSLDVFSRFAVCSLEYSWLGSWDEMCTKSSERFLVGEFSGLPKNNPAIAAAYDLPPELREKDKYHCDFDNVLWDHRGTLYLIHTWNV
jgi:hypothetical protein